jgi:hypothetical protein
MSRSFLILTTMPPNEIDDPSERSAVLAAHREAALDVRSSDEAIAPGAPPGGGPPAARPAGRLFFAFVDRLGPIHSWPRLLPEHRPR